MHMNARAALIWFGVMTCVVGVMAYVFLKEGGSDIGPRYTLEAFKRTWSINVPNPKAGLVQGRETNKGWLVEYGDGLTLLMPMTEGTVTGVHIRYEAGPDQGAGGPRFLLLMNTAINVGTFRWPQARIDQVRHTFNHMSPLPKSYRYLYSSFKRTFTQGEGWEFMLDFVPNLADENTP